MRRLLGISSMLVMSLIIILVILKIVLNVNQLKNEDLMIYFYESVNEYENAVKNNGWKVSNLQYLYFAEGKISTR